MSTRHLSPSARAAAHSAKIEARNRRRARTPGPGSYEPGPSAVSGKNGGRPSSAFKSSTKRMEVEEAHQGDPGVYDPYAPMELGRTTKQTFARSMRSGEGGFGSKSAREMKQDIMGRDTPGPGSYNSKTAQGLFDKMPSSAFRSSSQQRLRSSQDDTPGVGSYQPRPSSVEPNAYNGGAGMRSKGERFKEERTTTEDGVGPGMYDYGSFMSTDLEKSLQKGSRAHPGFGTRAEQHALPFNGEGNNTPGPGSYDAQDPTGTGVNPVKRPSSAFKSSTKRMEVEEAHQGDPGTYDPYAPMELAHTTKQTFARSMRSGEGGFGSKSAREMKQDIMGKDTPGPGSYRVKKAQVESQTNMPSSAFRSSSQQRTVAMREDTPGVGSYQPRPSSVEPNAYNGGAGMRSKGERFKEETTTTGDAVGPGSYVSEVSASGARSTIQGASTADASGACSAVFASDTVRDLPY